MAEKLDMVSLWSGTSGRFYVMSVDGSEKLHINKLLQDQFVTVLCAHGSS